MSTPPAVTSAFPNPSLPDGYNRQACNRLAIASRLVARVLVHRPRDGVTVAPGAREPARQVLA